jgi:hypothetical protein
MAPSLLPGRRALLPLSHFESDDADSVGGGGVELGLEGGVYAEPAGEARGGAVHPPGADELLHAGGSDLPDEAEVPPAIVLYSSDRVQHRAQNDP